ncbi:hypothetical protein [Corynebacterium sp. MSK150]|uniref:hypothetical protein n=1 Tax=Corynebacterium sp. MSK150 TaxID=3050209 RepID=UPI002550BA38|nr:hypothetical protein [Corynebacterium sp. MSK150]MDK8523914.1 hypothetical protein [Corynebacterium sp. MSK150]
MLLEHLADFHRRPLIVHGPQEQILDDAAAKGNQLSMFNLSRDTLNDQQDMT